eukprot:2970132-Rhodomonas_salina.1
MGSVMQRMRMGGGGGGSSPPFLGIAAMPLVPRRRCRGGDGEDTSGDGDAEEWTGRIPAAAATPGM